MSFEIRRRDDVDLPAPYVRGELIYPAGAHWRVSDALRQAVAEGRSLRYAYLVGRNFYGANLSGLDLAGADLADAALYNADLSGADLSGVRLVRAKLQHADLRLANLAGADLFDANLFDANLFGADLEDAALPPCKAVPPPGDFTAYKLVYDVEGRPCIATLTVPADARRTGSLVSRKCRAEAVITVRIGLLASGEGVEEAASTRFALRCVRYAPGERTVARDDGGCEEFSPDIRHACAPGIHFFLEEEDARLYAGGRQRLDDGSLAEINRPDAHYAAYQVLGVS